MKNKAPATSNPQDLGARSNESKTDEISSLLLGDSDDEVIEGELDSDEDNEDLEDSDEEETLSEESTDEESEESSEDDATWSSVLGVDEDQLQFDDKGNIAGVKVKVNGEVSTVKMPELIAGYQINKSLTQKSQAFAEEKKAFDAKIEQVATIYKTKLENVEAMSSYLNNQLVGEYNNIDWNKLRVENPAEYAAARQDFASRASELQEAQQAIIQERQMVEQKQTVEMTQRQQAFLMEQAEKMLANNPTWQDKEVYQRDMTGIKTFLSNQYGFTSQDFQSVSDARLIELVKDAKRFHEGKKFAEKKVLKTVPKFQKSVGKSKKPTKLAALTKQAKAATGSHKRKAQADAITELLIGGS